MIHTVTFNPVIDLIYHVPNFKKGTTFRCKDFVMVPAGKGITVSYALACLEEESSAYTIISEDRLQVYQNACTERGITLYPVTGHLKMRYHSTLLDQHDHTVTHIQTTGDTVSSELADSLINQLLNNLHEDDIVVLSGSLPAGVDPSIYAVITEECREYKASVILDTSSDALLEGIQAKPMMVKINQTEAEELTKSKIHSLADCKKAVVEIHDMSSAPYVVVTLGKEGLIASGRNGLWKLSLPMEPEEVMDTVGCGDALTAGLAYCLAWHRSEEDMYTYSIACASAAATHAGPSQFNKSEINP